MLGQEQKATVVIPNVWGLGDGEPFVIPLHPNMAEVFAQTDKPDRYKLFFAYLSHPDEAVKLATLVEAKKLGVYLGENQAVVDRLADPSPEIRQAAAELISASRTATEFSLRCLSEEISRTAWTSTMTRDQARAALELLREAIAPDKKQEFEESVAEVIGEEYSR